MSQHCTLPTSRDPSKEDVERLRRDCYTIVTRGIPETQQRRISVPDEEQLKKGAREAIELTLVHPLTKLRAGFGARGSTLKSLSSKELHFSQKDCSYNFTKPVEGKENVGDLAAALYLGDVLVRQIPPLIVFLERDEYISCDNRRLSAIKLASLAAELNGTHFDDRVPVEIVHRKCHHKVSTSSPDIVVVDKNENRRYHTNNPDVGSWPAPLRDAYLKRRPRKSRTSSRFVPSSDRASASSPVALYTADEMTKDIFLDPKKRASESTRHGLGDFEQKRPLNAVSTNFVTKELMNSPEARMRLLSAFMIGTDEALKCYAKRKGLKRPPLAFFKGGTVCRLLISDLLSGLSPFAQKMLADYMKPVQKLSDYDFAIVLPEKVRKNEADLIQLNVCLYAWLLRFRQYLSEHISDFFPPFATRTQLHDVLMKLKESLQRTVDSNSLESSNAYKGVIIDRVSIDPANDEWVKGQGAKYEFISDEDTNRENTSDDGKSRRVGNQADFAILRDLTKKDEKDEQVRIVSAEVLLHNYGVDAEKILPVKRRGQRDTKGLYVSHNPLLEFRRENLGEESVGALPLIKFALNRIKLGIRVFFRKDGSRYQENWPGEVVDLSCSLLEQEDKSQDVGSFRFLDTDVTFNSYTLEGYLHDMHNMMFTETLDRPWVEGGKMEKKTNRLSALLAVGFYLRGRRKSKRERLKIIIGLGECMKDPKKNPKKSGTKWFDDLQESILKSIHRRKPTQPDAAYEDYCNKMKEAWQRVSDVLTYEALLRERPQFSYINPKFMEDLDDA